MINLGTGKGVTVKELVSAFEKVYGKSIHKRETGPRPGDIAGSYTNADKALKLLKWETNYPLKKELKMPCMGRNS